MNHNVNCLTCKHAEISNTSRAIIRLDPKTTIRMDCKHQPDLSRIKADMGYLAMHCSLYIKNKETVMTKQNALNLAIKVLEQEHSKAYEGSERDEPNCRAYLDEIKDAVDTLRNWKPGQIL